MYIWSVFLRGAAHFSVFTMREILTKQKLLKALGGAGADQTF